MGPNNGENQSGGVATLETPQQAPATPEGNGLLPTPGASAPEATGAVAQAENVAAAAWAGSETPPAATPGAEATAPATAAAPEVKPLDAAKPFVSPDMASASATVANREAQQQAFVAQQNKEKRGWGNKLLGLVGLRGGVQTVEQPANATPDRLKDGVTPPVPNVTPEAAAAVNQEPVKLSSTEMDAAMKQGAMEGKAILEPSPDAAKTEVDSSAQTTSLSQDMEAVGEHPAQMTVEPEAQSTLPTTEPTSTLSETPSVEASPSPAPEPTSASVSGDALSSTTETPTMDAQAAITEADSIVKNAAETNSALSEIDKTATDAMGATEDEAKPADTTASVSDASTAGAFPSYDIQTEANKAASAADAAKQTVEAATPEASGVDSASSWPAAPTSEPSAPSGPAAEPVAPVATSAPEYQPSAAMTSAGEAAAPTTPGNWSVDASAVHPAPVVESVPPAPEAPSSLPSPEPNALNLEASATPLPGAPTETPPPFGTGMPPSMGEATESPVMAPSETDAPSPTVPEAPVEPTLSSVSTTAAPEPPPMDISGQASQVAASAETADGTLPTSGVSAPAMESGVSMGGNVLESAASVADAAGASSLGTATASETSAAAEPALTGVGASTSTTEATTDSGTPGTPPLATS